MTGNVSVKSGVEFGRKAYLLKLSSVIMQEILWSGPVKRYQYVRIHLALMMKKIMRLNLDV